MVHTYQSAILQHSSIQQYSSVDVNGELKAIVQDTRQNEFLWELLTQWNSLGSVCVGRAKFSSLNLGWCTRDVTNLGWRHPILLSPRWSDSEDPSWYKGLQWRPIRRTLLFPCALNIHIFSLKPGFHECFHMFSSHSSRSGCWELQRSFCDSDRGIVALCRWSAASSADLGEIQTHQALHTTWKAMESNGKQWKGEVPAT